MVVVAVVAPVRMKIILPALRLVEAPKAPPADNYLYLEFVAGGSWWWPVPASLSLNPHQIDRPLTKLVLIFATFHPARDSRQECCSTACFKSVL